MFISCFSRHSCDDRSCDSRRGVCVDSRRRSANQFSFKPILVYMFCNIWQKGNHVFYVSFASLLNTVMILSFRTDRSWQTLQTQIRLRSSLIRVYTVCNSLSIFWMHHCMVKPLCSNFRAITATFSGVRIFRSFTVILMG